MIALYILCALLLLPVVYFAFLLFIGLFVDPKKEYDKDSRFYRGVLYLSTAIGIWLLGIKVHTSGMENIPTHVKPLFVSNHVSKYDPIIQWQVLRKWNVAFISKASNFKLPFFGRIVRRCCFMTIDRQNIKSAAYTVKRAAALLEKGEVAVGVYPEGTRNSTDELLPFHNGVFMIAQKADRPIVVLTVRGTKSIYKNYLRRITHVYIDVAEVIPAEEIRGIRSDDVGSRVRAAMEKKLNEAIG